jgi:hypothetical protein
MAHLPTQASRGGLVRAIDPQTARRQLHMSLGALGILAVVSAGAALGLRPGPMAHSPVSLTVQAPQMVHVQHARNMAGE